MSAPAFDVGVCLPTGRDFRLLSDSLREVTAFALSSPPISGQSFTINAVFLQEHCGSVNTWARPVDKLDVIIGPVCSQHAAEALEANNTDFIAISPTVDLPSIAVLSHRRNFPFFRTCGDGTWYANEVARLVRVPGQRCVIVFDSEHRWWSEVAHVTASLLSRSSSGEMDVELMELRHALIRRELLQQALTRATNSLSVCYLGGDVTDDFLEQLFSLRRVDADIRLTFPRGLETAIIEFTSPLESTGRTTVQVVGVQAPDISPDGLSHLRALRRAIGTDLTTPYAAQAYDALLAAARAFARVVSGGLPRSGLARVIASLDFEGASGRIRFDANGNRKDQGRCHLAVLRDSAFVTLRPDVSRVFDNLKLQLSVRRAAERLFKDGHYAQAVSESLKVVEQEVKRVSGITGKYGTALMGEAFNEKAAKITLAEDDDIQEGYKLLFMGSMLGIRNLYAHHAELEMDPEEALQYLGLASLLMHRLDRRVSPD